MRQLSAIWKDYSDTIDFYALETDPSADLSEIARVGRERGYSWSMGRADGSVRALKVLGHSIKVAFDASGEIVYRDGFGQGDAAAWRRVFNNLSGG